MSAAHPLPVRYVLYTHYPELNDWEEYRLRKTPVEKLEGVRFLIKHLSGLSGLLTWPGFEGLLVLFYSPGLNECLAGIANQTNFETLKSAESLQFAEAVNDHVEGVMKKQYKELLPRLRFFTALDLHQVFGRIRSSTIVDRLTTWMVGDNTSLTYDSPKIIEAIVRLRLLGSGVPVFRVDFDVLLRGKENWRKKNLEFSSTIGSCLTAYQLRRDSPNLASFIFSASYDHKVLNKADASEQFHKWGRAYATRVFPALAFEPGRIEETLRTIGRRTKEAQGSGDTVQDPAKTERTITAQEWDRYASKSFNARLARRFFGFEPERFVTSKVGGIGQIGAHPMASVISGAMLYLSDGAILDLPPFSNFRRNVSWVDDHLKYCLHRELRHFRRPGPEDRFRGEPKPNDLLTYAKIDDVVVHKAGRKIDKDLRKYIFDGYLPTLLRGTILDAWITPDPVLKYRQGNLTEEKRPGQTNLSHTQSEGLLPSALQYALEACRFTPDTRRDLKRRLRLSALKRITLVRRQWAALVEDELETFASIWANGRAHDVCKDLDLTYAGIVDDPNLSVDVELAPKHLTHEVLEDLGLLEDDACDYIDWTREWPRIVQVVRSIEQGTLKTDINYESELTSSSVESPTLT